MTRSPMPVRAPGAGDVAGALLLAFLWGSSYMVVKVALADLTPLAIAFFRILVAAVALLAVVRLSGARLPTSPSVLAFFAVLGVLNNVVPFFLTAWGTQHITSGEAALLMAFSPLASHLISHFATDDDRLTVLRSVGLACGFAGILVLLGPSSIEGLGSRLAAEAAVLLGAVSYSLAGILTRRAPPVGTLQGATLAMLAGAVTMLPLLLLLEPVPEIGTVSGESILAVIYLGLMASALSSLIRFRLVREVGLTFVSMANYLVPVLGVLLGVALLDEPLDLPIVAALVLVTAGMLLNRLGARTAATTEASACSREPTPSRAWRRSRRRR